MSYKLIGDIGSTTADWACLSTEGPMIFSTEGFNPVQHHPTHLQEMLKSVRSQCPEPISEINYYGSGVSSVVNKRLVEDKCREFFPQASIHCESDMLGAARAMSHGKESVICILGTGSNSCVFDGQRITQQIPSLGFPLGDEGSGADIGRACVRGFYYGLMPDNLKQTFAQVLPADRSEFLSTFNQHTTKNKYLAGLVKLLTTHRDSDYVRILVMECFRSFIRLHITPYQVSWPVHFAGSVAHGFQEMLIETLIEENIKPGTIFKSPLSGLIDFHQNMQI